MARCPFARWEPISGSCGSFVGGPFRIIHHTTEGSSAQDALNAYRTKKADPHFTVDGTTIYQHVDSAVAARALRNASGGVQTNRLSAIQIEVVGFAGKAKSKKTLTNLARLCRWIEGEHGIERTWPCGPPRAATALGRDPGGHNRSAQTWTSSGGHYGHCHVPENTHWDPAYSKLEFDFVMNADFDSNGQLSNAGEPLVKALLDRPSGPAMSADVFEVMDDHADVGEQDD